ncbi:unnamed protein product [Dibothriocephalus latus]|uniref:KN homeodomain domain-containing protein n=1 Tax=Dibothriocephalus latus TaxID=60516 RepID=A0A3P6U0M3_DIBLA|nr:unnamed protein product [Dibothriocephalus latus]
MSFQTHIDRSNAWHLYPPLDQRNVTATPHQGTAEIPLSDASYPARHDPMKEHTALNVLPINPRLPFSQAPIEQHTYGNMTDQLGVRLLGETPGGFENHTRLSSLPYLLERPLDDMETSFCDRNNCRPPCEAAKMRRPMHSNCSACLCLDLCPPSACSTSFNWPYEQQQHPCGGGTLRGTPIGLEGPRRKNATREKIATLKTWLQDHATNPYPTKGEKIMLAIVTKMTFNQEEEEEEEEEKECLNGDHKTVQASCSSAEFYSSHSQQEVRPFDVSEGFNPVEGLNATSDRSVDFMHPLLHPGVIPCTMPHEFRSPAATSSYPYQQAPNPPTFPSYWYNDMISSDGAFLNPVLKAITLVAIAGRTEKLQPGKVTLGLASVLICYDKATQNRKIRRQALNAEKVDILYHYAWR